MAKAVSTICLALALFFAAVSLAPAADRASAPPVNVSAPVLSGPALVGAWLKVSSPGTWTANPDGISFAYQWLRCNASGANCVAVVGASEDSYHLVSADLGNTILLRVTASNIDGQQQAYSPLSQVIVQQDFAPYTITIPVISGQDEYDLAPVGRTLTVSQGRWSAYPDPFYSYQWYRCDEYYCSPIAGADTSSYTTTVADISKGVRAIITASNSFDSGIAISDQTITVLAPDPVIEVSSQMAKQVKAGTVFSLQSTVSNAKAPPGGGSKDNRYCIYFPDGVTPLAGKGITIYTYRACWSKTSIAAGETAKKTMYFRLGKKERGKVLLVAYFQGIALNGNTVSDEQRVRFTAIK